MLGLILSSVIKESTFLKVLRCYYHLVNCDEQNFLVHLTISTFIAKSISDIISRYTLVVQNFLCDSFILSHIKSLPIVYQYNIRTTIKESIYFKSHRNDTIESSS